MRLEALGSSVSSNFQSGVWVKDTLTARADGEQVTRFVNVGELKPDATIANVRIYEFDSKFRLSNVRIAKSGVYAAAGPLEADRRDRHAIDRRPAASRQSPAMR